jgi:MFS family permease
MVGIASAAIYSVLVPISEATNLTLDDLNSGTGYMFLAFGWGCLFWQPLALQYGKRPVYLISILATMAIQVWAPFTKSNGQWIANKILRMYKPRLWMYDLADCRQRDSSVLLLRVFARLVLRICEYPFGHNNYGAHVYCRYFQHERGTYIALYALLLAGSNFFAPIIAGFIADSQGWQWVLYWCAIFCAIGFVFLFFFMEETNYSRSIILAHENEPDATVSPASVSDSGDEKKDASEADVEPAEIATVTHGKQKTYLDKIKPFRTYDFRKRNHLLGMVSRPLIFLSFPVIFYAGFSYGSNLVWFNVLNGTASLVLAGPPYNFAASMVGVSYVSPLIGVAIGSLYTGYIGDRIVLKMARQNGGILEPEHRLWLFAPSLLLIPFGLILWGVGKSSFMVIAIYDC